MSGARQRLTTTVKQTVIITLITCLLFALVEGISSIGLAVLQIKSPGPSAEASLYDEAIGWVGRPDTYLPDLYGKGKDVRTNARGFRDDTATDATVADSKHRIICSGDSFTYGQGVANEHAWCHLLEDIDSRVDSVNMGQPGYGVDQMYLWYMRDGLDLEHSIHIFAFISGDLTRMGARDQHRYGKPTLAIEDGNLEAENVPVPRFRWWLSRSLAVADLQSVEFGQRLLGRLFSSSGDGLTLVERLGPVARAVFEQIRTVSEESDIVPVFVYLPTDVDVAQDKAWRGWAAETMRELNANYIDLTEDLRRLPAAQAASYFINRGMPAAGHYTEAGNRWVAETLYGYLTGIEPITELLPDSGQGIRNLSAGEDHSAGVPLDDGIVGDLRGDDGVR